MGIQEAYEQKLQAKLDLWNAEIDRLKAKAASAQADAKVERENEIHGLEAKRDKASTKLVELRQSGENAWEDLKAGVDSAWDSLGAAVERAAARFD